MTIKIRLPWPDSALNPNSRNKWQRIRATTSAREYAYITTRALGYDVLPMPACDLQLTVTAYPPDKRRRDLDNLPTKQYQDGICDALGIDDRCIKHIVREWGKRKAGGEIVMTLDVLQNYCSSA